MNADDLRRFVYINGALQPPFQKPIVGREAIAVYLRDEGQGLTMKPKQGISERIDDGYGIKSLVQSKPWFGKCGDGTLPGEIYLKAKFFFVGIDDLLASPKEPLNLTQGRTLPEFADWVTFFEFWLIIEVIFMADIVDTAVNAGSFNTLVAAVKAAGRYLSDQARSPSSHQTMPLPSCLRERCTPTR